MKYNSYIFEIKSKIFFTVSLGSSIKIECLTLGNMTSLEFSNSLNIFLLCSGEQP